MHLVAAKIAVKYGGKSLKNLYTENNVREFWKYDDPIPSPSWMGRLILAKNLRWFINNYIQSDDEIWNADFLHGMAINGNLTMGMCASMSWIGNTVLTKLVQSAPFGGRLTSCKPHERGRYNWNNVPAFYMKYSEDSSSFMAGALAAGQLFTRRKKNYARYCSNLIPYFEKWNLPIEYTSPTKLFVDISPFWPALFSIKMPKEIGESWFNISGAMNADNYAPILWKLYADNRFPKDAIPYLKSRRAIYYKFKSEEGAMKRLEKLRIEIGLAELDFKVRDMVREWIKNKSDKE